MNFDTLELIIDTVLLAISYHSFRFLIGIYYVAEIQCFIKKKKKEKKEIDKNTNFNMKNKKNVKKVYIYIK